MSSLVRALSWPLLSQSQAGIGGPCSGGGNDGDGLNDDDEGRNEPNGANGHHPGEMNGATRGKKNGLPPSPTFQQLMAARRLLCRRYYPEGGWGWIVIVVGILVHTMTHGIQLSFGLLLDYVMRYFGKRLTDTAPPGTADGTAPLLCVQSAAFVVP
ncbi:uncharacterized protein LOC129760287 [Uranotaenia lowii]|uniref:uncharacterized protein LOC129760287 n=1 Tax=Uranotaenia lowii TaxID=190385 RepID=UPI00247A29A4|nr:uncharacterized protein LOC129760287 [Uranotaenia lowii]